MSIARGTSAFVRWMATLNGLMLWWCAVCWQYSPHVRHQWVVFWMTIPNWNMFKHFPNKKKGKMSFSKKKISNFFLSKHHSCNKISISFVIILYFISLRLNLNRIEFKDAISFNVFIWMELNFHKINSFFPLMDHDH